jgi:hypothetical protein
MPLSKCPEGEIHRKAYNATRSATGKTYHVKSSCIEDKGNPGKTPKSKRIAANLSKPEDELGQFGYSNLRSLKAEERHAALAKAIRNIASAKGLSEHDAAVKVMRRVNLLMVLNKNTNKSLSLDLERDRNWIGRQYLGVDYSRM